MLSRRQPESTAASPRGKANHPFKLPNLARNSKHSVSARPEDGRPAPQPKVEAKSHQKVASTPTVPKPEAKEPIFIDRWLGTAEKAVGQHLPNWVFSRGGALVVLASLVITILFPEVVSTLLMIAGTILLVLGGVTMLDNVLAARLLKAKVTPTQCLIVGGLLVFVGVVFGMLA